MMAKSIVHFVLPIEDGSNKDRANKQVYGDLNI